MSVLLMFAALHAHVQLVAKLLRRGASVDHQNSDGSTALMGAAFNVRDQPDGRGSGRGGSTAAKARRASATVVRAKAEAV